MLSTKRYCSWAAEECCFRIFTISRGNGPWFWPMGMCVLSRIVNKISRAHQAARWTRCACLYPYCRSPCLTGRRVRRQYLARAEPERDPSLLVVFDSPVLVVRASHALLVLVEPHQPE